MNTLSKASIAAVILAASAQASAGLDFTVDTSGDPSVFALPNLLTTFTTDGMSGDYSEVIQVNPDGSFDATILLDINSFDNLNAGETGLGINYGLYSIINISGQALPPVVSGGTTFFSTAGWSGDFNIVWDQELDSDTNTITPSGVGSVVIANDSDDVELLTGQIANGGSSGTANNGGFNLFGDDVALTTAGESFFVAPNPFHTMLFSTGDLENFFTLVDFTNFLTVQTFEGEASITFVNAPSTVGILGLSIFGAAFAARRRKS